MALRKEPIISLKDIVVKFKSRGNTLTAIRNITFDIMDGEIIAFVGKSTSGKTVLSKVFTNAFKEGAYISNGSVMYYPNQKTIDSDHASIHSNVDLTSYHRGALSNLTRFMVQNTNQEIKDAANIRIAALRSEIADIQIKEAKKQLKNLNTILKNAIDMSEFYLASDLPSFSYANNKTDTIHNWTLPSVPTILELIKIIKKHDLIINQAYETLSRLEDKKAKWDQKIIIENAQSEILECKKLISKIQVEIAENNFKYLDKIKKDIEFLEEKETFNDNKILESSLIKMYEYNQILKLESDSRIMERLVQIKREQKIISDANFELANFSRLKKKDIVRFSPIVKDIKLNKNDLSLVKPKMIDNNLNSLEEKSHLTQFEVNLKSLLLKMKSSKSISENEVDNVLEQWKFQTKTRLQNRIIANKQLNLIRGITISIILQDPMTYLKTNVKVGSQMIEAICSNHKISKQEAHKKALDLLYKVGLVHADKIFNSKPTHCSPSVRQLFAIAHAIAYNPKVLVLDEPTSNLGLTIEKDIIDLIISLKKEFNFTIILFSSNFKIASQIADRVVVLNNGEIIEHGLKNEIISNASHPQTISLLQSVKEQYSNNLSKDSDNVFEIIQTHTIPEDHDYALENYVITKPKFLKISKTHYVLESSNELEKEGK